VTRRYGRMGKVPGPAAKIADEAPDELQAGAGAGGGRWQLGHFIRAGDCAGGNLESRFQEVYLGLS